MEEKNLINALGDYELTTLFCWQGLLKAGDGEIDKTKNGRQSLMVERNLKLTILEQRLKKEI